MCKGEVHKVVHLVRMMHKEKRLPVYDNQMILNEGGSVPKTSVKLALGKDVKGHFKPYQIQVTPSKAFSNLSA